MQQAVGEHQPSLGIGVGDLDRRTVAGADDVAGAEGGAVDHVVGRADDTTSRTGSPSFATAPIASITAAPPDMSNFIPCIDAGGLSE